MMSELGIEGPVSDWLPNETKLEIPAGEEIESIGIDHHNEHLYTQLIGTVVHRRTANAGSLAARV